MKQSNIDNLDYLTVKILNKLATSSASKQRQLIKNLLVRTATIQQIEFDDQLTPAETACLLLMAKGQSRTQTADFLGLTVHSVQTYRKRIKRKLGCDTLFQAVFEGARFGYITPKRVRRLSSKVGLSSDSTQG